MKHLLSLAVLLLSFCACAAPSGGANAASAARPTSAPDGAGTSLTGVLVPAASEAIALWPEAYSGELLVLSVRPHGSSVAAGELVAELDLRRLEEQLADARLELRSLEIKHAGLLERNAIADESAAMRLKLAEAELERARRALDGYEKREREFTERSDALSQRREQSWESDQLDELEQLEAMYDADELVDATEDIVLKRQRRDVAMTKASNELSRDRRNYRIEVTDAIEMETRREAVAKKEQELAHLRRTQAVDAEGRADAEARSAAQLAKKETHLARLESDRELLSVRAPRAGILLHGSADALRKGAAARVERGSKLQPRTDAFVVADPERMAVALDVPESMRASLAGATSVSVRPKGREGELQGTVSIAAFPGGAKGDESTFEATVELSEAAAELVPGAHAEVEVGSSGR